MKGWFEEYACGCISDTVKSRKLLLGYCPTHGQDRRGVFRDFGTGREAMQVERVRPSRSGKGE